MISRAANVHLKHKTIQTCSFLSLYKALSLFLSGNSCLSESPSFLYAKNKSKMPTHRGCVVYFQTLTDSERFVYLLCIIIFSRYYYLSVKSNRMNGKLQLINCPQSHMTRRVTNIGEECERLNAKEAIGNTWINPDIRLGDYTHNRMESVSKFCVCNFT